MVCTEHSSSTGVPKKETQARRKRKSRPQGLPSPALCCACGLCIMLAGINITLVGAFAFSTLVPASNPPIIIGPILLLLAFSFFGACCVCSRLPPAQSSRRADGRGGGLGFMGRGGGAGGTLGGGAAFEIETSEHTMQDTTAVQLSPTNSPSSSNGSSPEREAPAIPANATVPAPDYGPPAQAFKLFTMEANGPASAAFSASMAGEGAVTLTLPSDGTAA